MSDIASKPELKSSDRAEPVDTLSIRGKDIAWVHEARTFFSRLRGLHSFLPLGHKEGLIIRPCNAVHTMTMRNRIDILFVDRNGKILKAESVQRFRFKRCSGASAVVEMSEGSIKSMGIVVGDVLQRRNGAWA